MQGRSASSWCLVLLFFAGMLAQADPAPAANLIRGFDFAATEANGEPSSRAGAHPDRLEASIAFSTLDESGEASTPRDLIFQLQPGLVGSPAATPLCGAGEFRLGACPPESQIGYVRLITPDGVIGLPIYNLEPLPGVVGEFGFMPSPGAPVRLALGLQTGEGYGLTIASRNLPEALILEEADLVLWGVPAASSHDGFRGSCLGSEGTPTGELCPSTAAPRPLLTNPPTCQPALEVELHADSWEHPGLFEEATAANLGTKGEPIGIEDCESLPFRPTLTVSPSVSTPRTPTGLKLEIQAPQPQTPDSPAEAPLEDARVTLPEGVALSPPAAAGLGVCRADQIRLGDDSRPSCPDASKLGSVRIETPLIVAPLKGWVYLAEPADNPSGSRFAVYGEAAADGVLIKLAGRVEPDPVTGQLQLTLEDVPQLPFSDLEVDLFGGPRAPLVTPLRCGTYSSSSVLTAWGSRTAVAPADAFSLASGCSEPSFAPSLIAGTVDPAAGSYTPLVLKLERGGDDAEFASSLSVQLPPGVSAVLGGTATCPETDLRAAGSVMPGCPASSRIGSATVSAGRGPEPLYLTGSAYLAGPYRGAPFSLAVVLPAQAGPFDLGTLVERIAVAVDPRSGRLTARTDELPGIRDGVPLQLRSLALELDRPGFIRNPTSCEPMAITGIASSRLGQRADLSQPFQVGGCSRLEFKPRLSLHILGGAGRNAHPGFRAVLRSRPREATIAGVTIGFPTGELLDLRHLGAMCGRGVPPERCPVSSRIGSAQIWSPLLRRPMRGAIYLRTPNGRLPRLQVDLRGGGFELVLGGRATAAHQRLLLHLNALPDLPLSKAVLTLAGARRGLLVNSEALCPRARRAEVRFRGHNGAQRVLRPVTRPRGGC